jgi:hypothetical protein
MNDISGIDGLFRPFGARTSNRLRTHGSRRGLYSFAASRRGKFGPLRGEANFVEGAEILP